MARLHADLARILRGALHTCVCHMQGTLDPNTREDPSSVQPHHCLRPAQAACISIEQCLILASLIPLIIRLFSPLLKAWPHYMFLINPLCKQLHFIPLWLCLCIASQIWGVHDFFPAYHHMCLNKILYSIITHSLFCLGSNP